MFCCMFVWASTAGTEVCEPQGGCWELNSDPLEKATSSFIHSAIHSSSYVKQTNKKTLLFCFVFFQTGSHYVALAVLELTT